VLSLFHPPRHHRLDDAIHVLLCVLRKNRCSALRLTDQTFQVIDPIFAEVCNVFCHVSATILTAPRCLSRNSRHSHANGTPLGGQCVPAFAETTTLISIPSGGPKANENSSEGVERRSGVRRSSCGCGFCFWCRRRGRRRCASRRRAWQRRLHRLRWPGARCATSLVYGSWSPAGFLRHGWCADRP